MPPERASRDPNRGLSMLAVTNDSNQYISQLRVDPATLRLLVNSVMVGANFDGSGNLKVAGSFAGTTAPANNNWGQALATVASATATVVNIASSPIGYKVRGFVVDGTGDGYWFITVSGATVLSGRTRSTQPTLSVILPNPMAITTASVVALKVTNESGSTADYEGTLLGE